jgi:hypothetical protein
MEKNLSSCVVWFVMLILSFFIQEQKKGEELWNIIYKKWYINFKKTCGCKSWCACKNIWRQSTLSVERYIGKTTCKKRPNVSSSKILEFFSAKNPFKKYVQQNSLCKTSPFWLSKTISLFNLLKEFGLKHLVMNLYLGIVFTLRKLFSQKVLLYLVEKTKW